MSPAWRRAGPGGVCFNIRMRSFSDWLDCQWQPTGSPGTASCTFNIASA